MKSKIPFSLSFYRETLSRLRIFGIIISLAFTVLSTFDSATYLFTYISSLLSGQRMTTRTLLTLSDVNGSAALLVAIIMPIMTVMAFSFVMKRNEADFYDAIPVTKMQMAFSGMLAVLTSGIFTLVVSSVFPILVLIPCMGSSVRFFFARSLVEFLGYVIAMFLAVGAGMLAVSVTGTVKSAILTSAVILGAPRIIFAIMNVSIEMLNFSYVTGHIIPLFNNEWNILTSALVSAGKAFSNPWSFLYTAILAAIYIALGVRLFLSRKSEAANRLFANRIALHSVRITISTVFAVFGIFVICLASGLWFLGAALFVWSVIVYFIYGLAESEKRKENFISALKTLPILVGTVAFIGGFILLADFIMSDFSPSVEDIDSVSVVSENEGSPYLDYSEYVTLRSEHITLDDTETLKAVAAAIARIDDDEYSNNEYESAVFKIKVGGRTAYRRLHLTVEEMNALRAALSEQKDYESLWLNGFDEAVSPSVYVGGLTLGEEASYRVLDSAKAEIASLGFERWFEIYNYGDGDPILSYKIYYKNESYEITLPIFEELAETSKKCENERKSQAEMCFNEIKKHISQGVSGAEDGWHIDISYYSDEHFIAVYDRILPDSERSKGILNEIIPLLSTDAVDYDKHNVMISLYNDDLFDEGYYIHLSVKEGVSEQTITELFKKYGQEY